MPPALPVHNSILNFDLEHSLLNRQKSRRRQQPVQGHRLSERQQGVREGVETRWRAVTPNTSRQSDHTPQDGRHMRPSSAGLLEMPEKAG